MKRLKVLILLICIFSVKEVFADTINTHSTTSHTKEEIIEKYNNSKSNFNYNDSLYESNPSTSFPYTEGKLKKEVEEDVLNHLNFYRWMAGLREISINGDRQSYNQKGALIMSINNYLSHYPSRPNGMEDSMYNDGYSACGSRSGVYQGNIAAGIRLDQTPEAFITDNTNMVADVAHRSSLLKPDATQVSFGYVYGYSTMSIYYDGNNNNPDEYNPWPPAGYFPVEAMDQDSNTRWSMYLGNYSLTSNTKIILTNNGHVHIVDREYINTVSYNKTMYYNIPTALRNDITQNKIFKSGEVVNVKIENLSKNNKNYTINYDVRFFTVNEKKVEKVTLDKTSITLEQEDEEDIIATVSPSIATDKNLIWTSSDNSIATVENGRVKGIKEGKVTITATSPDGPKATCEVTVTKLVPGVAYTTHVENIGWQKYVSNGAQAGTSGKSLRLEAIKIKLKGIEYSGNIEYKTHIQNKGWERYFAKNNTTSGTNGEGLRLEAIKIRLTGEVEKHYDIYYRVHAENFGWLGWAKNGELSGTQGYSYRLEGIEIKLIPKGEKFSEYGKISGFRNCTNEVYVEPTKLTYTTHVQNIGWQDYVYDGKTAGTSGQALRLEAIKVKLEDQEYQGNVEYQTHIENIGWESYYKKNDELSGTSNQGLRVEAIKIKLTGEIANHFDIYYRVHAEEFGWLGWAKNGENAGTEGYAYRLEAIEIVLVEKEKEFSQYGKNEPFKNKNEEPKKIKNETKISYTTHVQNIGWQNYVSNGKMAGTEGKSYRLEGIKIKLENQEYQGNIEYTTHVQNIGWQNYVSNDSMAGTEGKSLRLEGIKIKLTGEIANHYDVYYRVHAENFGWMGWAKNDEQAGTAGYSYRLEGIEIELVSKGENFSEYGKTKAFQEKK